jgi:biopolymer transport protein ExbD
MGGVSVDSGGKGGRKSVDSNVNMVPMIDLLISVIAFLLMTAVWVQTGILQAQQPKGAPSAGPSQGPPQEQLKVEIYSDGRVKIGIQAADVHDIATGPVRHNLPSVNTEEIRTDLQRRHESEVSRNEVHLKPEGAVRYDMIIRVMDVIYEVWSVPPPPQGRTIRDQVIIRFI